MRQTVRSNVLATTSTPTPARRLGLPGALLLALLALAASPLAAQAPLRVGDAPPAASLTDLEGRTVRIPDDLKGKVVLVHFWAAGCSSCKEEMPAMESLQSRYRKKGLAIAAINVGQRRDAVKSFVAGLKVTYPIYLDQDTRVARAYEVVGVPKTVILDRNGVIRYKILGSASTESLNKLVTSLL
jgi:cytochrome c biogenesis protein CcmG, thiol:disulfide interchange protein DsbE